MAKMGRPTDNPRTIRITIRLAENENEILDYCVKKQNSNKTEILVNGLKKIYEELKEK